jgi:non-ribosomal peptide synthetase component F/aryl carrier-like protein
MLDQSVNWAFFTPSRARLLRLHDLQGVLEVLVVSGEPVLEIDRSLWSRNVPHLIIGYSPTEACVFCCAAEYTDHSTKPQHDIRDTVGHSITPISRIWVTDPDDSSKLMPIGALGELLVEGPTVARGYLSDDAKTAASFVHSLDWLLGSTTRLYRTGDLVRYNDDGAIIFISRRDDQVKVNGQRVELGEIESQIRECFPAASTAVELITLAGQTSRILVAFLQLTDSICSQDPSNAILAIDLSSDINGLEERLRERLPTYMLPKLYIPLIRLSLTVSGKLDRRALREFVHGLPEEQLAALQARSCRQSVKSIELPETDVERVIVDCWSRVLSMSKAQIGRYDNFFKMGGDSLAALKLSAETRKEELILTVSDILRNPILHHMATAASFQIELPTHLDVQPFSLLPGDLQQSARSLAAVSCNVPADHVEDVYPCTALQEGMMALSASRRGDYVASYVLELAPEIDPERWQQAWERTVRIIPVLRTRIAQLGRYGLFQIVQRPSQIPWSQVESLDVHSYVEKQKMHPPGLGQTLLNFAITKPMDSDSARQKRCFIWTIHHSLFDAWSLSLILDTVVQQYTSEQSEKRLLGFNTFIQHLLKTRSSTNWQRYWSTYLAGFDSAHFPNPPPSSTRELGITKPPASSSQADEAERFCPLGMSNKTASTIASTVQAAWAIAVGRYITSKDVVFGCTVFGRSAAVAGIEDCVGPTIATIPIRIRIDDCLLVKALLAEVQAQNAKTIPFEQAGLQQIRSLGADAAHACQFQTLMIPQPKGHTSVFDRCASLGSWHHEGQAQIQTYPLMLQCELSNDGVLMRARFDRRAVSVGVVETLLSVFSCVLSQLIVEPEIAIGSLKTIRDEALDLLWTWSAVDPKHSELPQISSTSGDLAKNASHAWVVDPHDKLQLCPPGSIGQLMLERSPAQDASVPGEEEVQRGFLDDPPWLLQGSLSHCGRHGRVLETKDLVRWSACGNLILAGSLDTHAKIHGEWVEFTEIERSVVAGIRATLPRESFSTSDIRVAVALIAPKDSRRAQMPVAFVSTSGGTSLQDVQSCLSANEEELYTHYAESMPAYAIPRSMVYLQSLPFIDEARVDRAQLRKIAAAKEQVLVDGNPPHILTAQRTATATEVQLRRLMAQTLQKPEDSVGLEDSFFNLGGDSITAMQLAAACRACRWSIQVSDIFREKSCARLATVCERQPFDHLRESDPVKLSTDPHPPPFTHRVDLDQMQQNVLPRVGITLADVEDIYPCSPVQCGMLLHQLKEPRSYFVRYVFGLYSADKDDHRMDTERMARAWSRVVQRHPILRTIFVGDVPGMSFAQIVLRHVNARIVLISGGTEHKEADAISEMHHYTPQHTVHLSGSSDGSISFSLTINHAYVDAHSVTLLLRDLSLEYNSLPLPQTVPYKRYIAYIESRTKDDDTQRFWTKYLSGVEPCHFPTDRECSQAEPLVIEVPRIDCASLQRFCRENGVTVSSLFYVAWALVLHAYTQNQRPCFGWIASGRDLPIHGVDEIVGPLIATLPLVVDLEQARSRPVLELVQDTHAATTDALQNQLFSLADAQHTLRLGSGRLFNTGISVRGASRGHEGQTRVCMREGNDPSEVSARTPVKSRTSLTLL